MRSRPRRSHAASGWGAYVGALAIVAQAMCTEAAAQAAPQSAAEPEVPEKVGKDLRALRVTVAPNIDGVLDDGVWEIAAAIEDFVQGEPDNMMAPTERTIVRVAYDDSYLYVAVRAYEEDPAAVAAGLGRRDNFPPSDRVSIYFDPRHDHLTGYVFQVNPSGVEGDFTLFDDTQQSFDYDGTWEVDTTVDSEGWTAEFRIPLSQMRFEVAADAPAVWGFNVRREIYRRGEHASWVAAPRGAVGNVSRFGHLVFGDPISPPGHLEVSPFVLSRSEHPASGSSTQEIDGGLNLRYGIGSSAVLAATLNPDFGQVEQDPAVLNLSVFETQFLEKRPFFLEDSRVFVPPYPQLPAFYSPRIGRRPGRIPLESGDELISRPDRTTILGAAKVTASSGDWTYGVLSALTDREHAVVLGTVRGPGGETSSARMRRLIEPRTSYNVARLQRNILGGSSNVGLIGTAVVRDGDSDAFTGGVDGVLRWSQNRFLLNNFWLRTQAPIGGRLRDGFGGATNFNYNSRSVRVQAHFDHLSRYFRNTDLGFLASRTNKTNVYAGVTLVRADPWRSLRSGNVFFQANRTWNGDDLVVGDLLILNFFGQFLNFWDFGAGVTHNFEVLSDLDTRGGPPVVVPANIEGYVFINTDARRSWRVFTNANWSEDVEGGWDRRLAVELQVQPSARLQASLSTSYSWGTDVAQWIVNEDVNGDDAVDHVFGRLQRDVIDVTARGTFAFTRDMTLELYLQPFVSVGDYDNIRRLARPSSFEFEPATLSYNPDFANRSLRSNLVLRWEYSSGSTLYLVWQSNGGDNTDAGRFDGLDDLGDAFAADRDDILMLKTTYWLSF